MCTTTTLVCTIMEKMFLRLHTMTDIHHHNREKRDPLFKPNSTHEISNYMDSNPGVQEPLSGKTRPASRTNQDRKTCLDLHY